MYFYVRNGYTIELETNKRHDSVPDDKTFVIKVYKGENANTGGLLSSTQVLISSSGTTTLNGKDLNDIQTDPFVGGVNSDTPYVGTSSTGHTSDFYVEKDGTYQNIGGSTSNLNKYFKAASWDESLQAYTFNGEVVGKDNLYVVNNQVGVFTTDGTTVYNKSVFGKNNEVLMTGMASDEKYYRYWGAESEDPNQLLADSGLTLGQYNKTIDELNSNIDKIHEDDISQIEVTANTGENATGGTIGLATNGGAKIPGVITVSSSGGTDGADTSVTFSNTNAAGETSSFSVPTGSKVEAVGATETSNTISGIKINGVDYTIAKDKDGHPTIERVRVNRGVK